MHTVLNQVSLDTACKGLQNRKRWKGAEDLTSDDGNSTDIKSTDTVFEKFIRELSKIPPVRNKEYTLLFVKIVGKYYQNY